MPTLLKVLIVDDAESDVQLIARQLQRSGATLQFERVDNAESMRAALAREEWDAVISDWSMPSFSAAAALAILRDTRSAAPFIIVSGAVGEEIAATAMRSGASDFILKDNLARLRPAIDREIEQVRALKRAEDEAARQKDEFLAILSHELRTPLQPVLGWANLLKSNWDGMEPDVRRNALATIERSSQALARVIEDVLDASRIVLGKVRIDSSPVDLNTIADAALDTVRASAEFAQLDLRMEPEAGPVVVLADPGRLQQVVWNLLSNAIKFTPPGGKVRLKVRRVGDGAVITVSDTGRGISPDFLPRVFDRFRQGDSSSIRAQGGLGLGLSIVYHLVQLHRGRVIASSEGHGRGAEFSVWLPTVEQAAETAPIERDHPSELWNDGADGAQDLKGVRILLVEDEPDSRDLLQEILENRGAQVCSCASASQALDSLAKEAPEIIVSDIEMPIMDGYAFMRQIRQLPDPRQRKIPAVALTAHARAEDRLQALSAGYQTHLKKPIQPDELTKAISSLLRRH